MHEAIAAIAEFSRITHRSREISKWQRRVTHFASPRWRRWIARYVLWCLVRDVKRDIHLREIRARKMPKDMVHSTAGFDG